MRDISGSKNPNWRGGGYKECKVCGAKFWVRPSKRPTARFCSVKCKNKGHSMEMRGEKHPNYRGGKVKRTCPNCGKVFYKFPSVKRVYCSRECRIASSRKTLRCPICKKEFQTTRSEARKRKTCSKGCQNKLLSLKFNQRVALRCLQCGKTFYIKKSRDRRRFCSKDCWVRWLNESGVRYGGNNPHWKGGYLPYYGSDWEKQKQRARARDGYTCRLCGVKEDGQAHDVHHLTPFREYGLKRYREANRLDNLITLCRRCHLIIENKKIDVEELIGSSHTVSGPQGAHRSSPGQPARSPSRSPQALGGAC